MFLVSGRSYSNFRLSTIKCAFTPRANIASNKVRQTFSAPPPLRVSINIAIFLLALVKIGRSCELALEWWKQIQPLVYKKLVIARRWDIFKYRILRRTSFAASRAKRVFGYVITTRLPHGVRNDKPIIVLFLSSQGFEAISGFVFFLLIRSEGIAARCSQWQVHNSGLSVIARKHNEAILF